MPSGHRAEAYEKLSSDPKALSDHRVQEELLNLVGRESGYIPTQAGDPEPGDIPDDENEAFAEYVGYLGGTVDSFADWNDPRQVSLLVHQGYDPDSRFAAKIAAHGKIALPCLMQMFRSSNIGLERAQVAPVIVQARKNRRSGRKDHSSGKRADFEGSARSGGSR